MKYYKSKKNYLIIFNKVIFKRNMENDLERNKKERWMQIYQNDINLYHEKREFEVNIKFNKLKLN